MMALWMRLRGLTWQFYYWLFPLQEPVAELDRPGDDEQFKVWIEEYRGRHRRDD